MIVLLIVLIVTNLVTLGVLARYLLRPVEHPRPDEALAESLSRHRRPATSTSAPRRVITIEILNALELAGTRGRLAGIAGTLAPGITRRMVYDQAVKLVRRKLAEERVVADVRLHVMRPEELGAAGPALRAGPAPSAEPALRAEPLPAADGEEPWTPADVLDEEDRHG